MTKYQLAWISIFALFSSFCQAQMWSASYQDGLRDAGAHKWQNARAAFLDASADRTEDSSEPTTLTNGKVWRDGAPYSPNFLAAYCGIKAGLEMASPSLQNAQLEACANELWALVDRGQACRETNFYLEWTLTKLGETDRVLALQERLHKPGFSANWKVDDSGIDPHELALLPRDGASLLQASTSPMLGLAPANPASPSPVRTSDRESLPFQSVPAANAATPSTPTPVIETPATPQMAVPSAQSSAQANPAQNTKPAKHGKQRKRNPNDPIPAADIDPVTGAPMLTASEAPTDLPNVSVISLSQGQPEATTPPRPDKFALIVGNTETRLGDELATPFAATDVEIVRNALVRSAGYPADNVVSVCDGTVAQIRNAAMTLAGRVSDGNVVTIYFVGAGQSLQGHDYLAGVDSTEPDPGQLLAKNDLLRIFVTKGARVFAFFEVNRPQQNGSYFGVEVPDLGAVAQMEATVAGEQVSGSYKQGKTVGLFADAFAGVLNSWHSNQVPIMDFGWEVFKRIRGGDTGTLGGGSSQTPTLPILKNIASDARF
jgi:hypothetical protein